MADRAVLAYVSEEERTHRCKKSSFLAPQIRAIGIGLSRTVVSEFHREVGQFSNGPRELLVQDFPGQRLPFYRKSFSQC